MKVRELWKLLTTACAVLTLATTAQAVDIPEQEPNETKALANNQPVFMRAGDRIVGMTTGTSLTVPGAASADTFRICPVVDPPNPIPAKYCWRLVLRTTTPGHGLTIRGLTQTAGVPNATSDVIFQTGRTVTTPENLRIIQWYSFGRPGEDVYIRVTGAAATTQLYFITLECVRVLTPEEPPQPGVPQIIQMSGVVNPGDVTVRPSDATGTTFDTDYWVYDENLNAHPTMGHDDPDTPPSNPGVTRPLAPGRYYIAFSTFNTANNLGSPPDDTFRTGNVLDFPGTVASTSTALNSTFTAEAFNPGGPVSSGTGVRPVQFDIVWFCFRVALVPTAPSCSLALTPAGGGAGSVVLARATVTGGTLPPSTGLMCSLNASAVGGGTVALLDDGFPPDAMAGDNIFSGNVIVGGGVVPCVPQTLTNTVTDDQGRGGTCAATFAVSPDNDLCANASSAPVGDTPFCTNGTGTDGTATCGGGGTGDIWFTHNPPFTGAIEINTCSLAGFDTIVSVHPACGGAATVCNDDNCGLQSRISVNVMAGQPILIRVAGFGTARGNGILTITAAGPMVITGVSSPPLVGEGDLITIIGTGFGNNPNNICCVVAPPGSPTVQSLRVVTATDTMLTARMQRVNPGMTGGPIMLARGVGDNGTFTPILQNVIPEDPQGTWAWCGVGGAMATSAQVVNLNPVGLPDPPGGTTEHFFGQVMGGRLCLFIDHNWGPNSYVRIILHLQGPGFSDDIDVGCIRIRGRGTAIECADAICDMIRCVLFQRLGVVVNCIIEPLPGGRAKITIIFKDAMGDPIPIQSAGAIGQAFMPNPLPLPTLGITTPFVGATQQPFPGGGVLANIGSSGQDGVSVDLPGAPNGLQIELVPLSLMSNTNSILSAQAWGQLDGQPRRRLGLTSVRGRIDSFFDVFADFSDIGSPGVRVQVMAGGMVVGDITVPPGQVAQVLPASAGQPMVSGCGKRPRWPTPLPCYWWDWDRFGRFLVGGQSFEGDRLVLLASSTPNTLGEITTFDVKGGNLQGNQFVISDARGVPSPCHGVCVADVDDGTGSGMPDGGVTIEDLLYYLLIFDQGLICADVDDGSGTGTPDGGVTIEDLLYYLQRFDSGC